MASQQLDNFFITELDHQALKVIPVLASVNAVQTDSNLVTAVVGKRIKVVQLFLKTATAATNVTFNTKGAGAGTAITAAISSDTNQIALPFSKVGWFETLAGEALTVTTGAGGTSAIQIGYVLVD